MNLTRRSFLNAALAFAATATLDPEKLLWVQGKKTFSIPKPRIGINEYEEMLKNDSNVRSSHRMIRSFYAICSCGFETRNQSEFHSHSPQHFSV